MKFEDLIAPLSKEEFFNDYFEKKPCYFGQVHPGFESVLSLKDIDHAINSFIFTPPEFRMAKEGVITPKNLYADSNNKRKTEEEYINFAKVLALYADGSTMIFESLHEKLKGLGDFCQQMELTFQNNVQSNIYLTPPGSKGFARHFDTHEVFVLQISGTKEWIIYDNPPIELPVRQHSHTPFKEFEYPVKERFVLKPGESVYIPRGYMHEAKSNTDLSLHVTFGLVTYNFKDFLEDLLNDAQLTNVFLRNSIPLEILKGERPAADLVKSFASNLSSINNEQMIANLLEKRKNYFLSTRVPRIEKGLSSIDSLSAITSETQLIRVEHLPYLIEESGDKVNLKVFNKTLSFPAAIKPYLEFICESDGFTTDDLGDNLSESSKKVLVEKLIKESIIQIAKPS